MSRSSLRRFALVTVAVAATLAGPGLSPATAIAAAQTPEPGTLTVTGFGRASAPAETVRVQILVGTGEFFAEDPSSELVGTPPADEGEAASPIVQALRDAGVPDDAVQVIVSPALATAFGAGSQGTARLDLTLENADLEQVNAVVDAAGAGATDEGLVILQIGVAYEIADCTGLIRDAREAAIADAQAQADVQAELLGVTRGDVVASEDVHTGAGLAVGIIPTDGGCPGETPATYISQGITLRPFEPTAPAEVEVSAALNLTFAIEGA